METPLINPGARPAAETTEAAAATHVQQIFNSIAPSYDLLNHLLSMGLDRRWWTRSARTFADTLQRPEARVLDLCCGTGDMTVALLKLRPQPETNPGAPSIRRTLADGWDPTNPKPAPAPAVPVPITGLDFSPQMLNRARLKYPTASIHWVEGDAMHLPYPDASFDLVTAAFGFRNLTNYAEGLTEIHRVLKPGGRVGILEANQPDGLSGALYTLYFRYVLPLVGGLISGDFKAYRYLPASVARFPRPPQMLALLTAAGFSQARWDGYLLRAAGLYVGTKA
jgi:demethylmenaquinone methyltransferase/2-methoxy-6-polyprenyl-1,4-benzoquinol methylase